MVRGAALVMTLALAWVYEAQASVLVPTYVLPPDSFVRDQRSLGLHPDTEAAGSQRTIKRLVGGHIKIKPEKEYGSSKNSIYLDSKTENIKFSGIVAPDLSGSNVGWNQGIWDDGMLMSSAGEGKEATKTKEVDEDKKTLSDQVAEGKYGLIQNEIFSTAPKRPGIVSYEPNTETETKDNSQSLGGLKKDEIWLAEDHLLVLKGGSFPERTKESDRRPWPPIDDYVAPNRQVKLPQKPKVPPPFPVRLTDNGPLIFLTPNGSVPASVFPSFFTGESEGVLPSPAYPYPSGTPYAPGDHSGNTTAGGAPQAGPAFPFLPGNASEGAFPFIPNMNGSFPEGFPPGAVFLPPPSNQTDLYDEDDPSIYYPPPYNFSYRADYNNKVPAGPLVPGIVLPPPPDFFAPLEETTTTTPEVVRPARPTLHTRTKTTTRPTSTYTVHRNKYKTRPTTTESIKTTEVPTTITTPSLIDIITTHKQRKPQRIPSRNPVRVHNLPEEVTTRTKTEKPVQKTRTKLTSKPLAVSVFYDYPEIVYNTKPPQTSDKPFIVYVPQKTSNIVSNDITSTPVPLRAFYSNTQNNIPTTKLQPVYNRKPNENSLASFYFYDEKPKTSPPPSTYFDGRNYYKTVPASQSYTEQYENTQTDYKPVVDVTYGAIDQTDDLFLWPQKQGPRTLTQEFFSVQKPKQQPVFVHQPKQRPDFYHQIADIQQTIDFYTTKRPKTYSHRARTHKPKAITSRPFYQFNYQGDQRQLPFRAPKLDPEPFRPMVSYSKPFNIENDFNVITSSVKPGYHQQYLVESVPVTTEAPASSKYFPKTKPRDEYYDDSVVEKDVRLKGNRNYISIQNESPAPAAHQVTRYPATTPNPISHGYYTKQDESYFDEITKNSFDIFGQKLDDSTRDINGLAVTDSLDTVKTPIDNNINLHYAYEIIDQKNPPSLDGDTLVNDRHPRPTINPDSEPIPEVNAELVQHKPPSLEGDTLVNERFPRPTINPDSEFIPIPNSGYRNSQQYRVQTQVQKPHYTGEQYDLNRPSLAGDTDVNYRHPLPAINPDAEWIGPVNNGGEGRPGSFVSYRLPGDGAHVYFLTPQAAQAAQTTRERYRTPAAYGR